MVINLNKMSYVDTLLMMLLMAVFFTLVCKPS